MVVLVVQVLPESYEKRSVPFLRDFVSLALLKTNMSGLNENRSIDPWQTGSGN